MRWLAVIVSLLSSQVVWGQTETSFDVQLFQPAPHANAFFTVESAAIARSFDLRASLFLSYAHRPLQLVGAGNSRLAGIVDHRFDAHLMGAVTLFNRLSLALTIPTTLYQGASLTGLTGTTTTLAPVAFGDLRISPKVGLLDQKHHFLDLAIAMALTFPTGNDGAFAGDRTVTFAPELDIGRRFGLVRFAINFGYTWRQRSQLFNLVVDPELYYRVGVGVEIPKTPIEAIAELYGRTSAVQPFRAIEQNPVEWLLGVKWTIIRKLLFNAGFGRGFTHGYGSPSLRVFAGLTFIPFMYEEPAGPPKDTDGDGIIDDDDNCPLAPEDKDGFEDDDGCPELDNDKDGVLDSNDKCPAAQEDRDNFEDEDGCPDPDNDKDGILDGDDKCPIVAEDKDGFQDEDGCPEPDNDGDGIPDTTDKCPNEPEVVNDFEDFDGCPDKGKTLVTVTKDAIDIMEKVQFESNSATILPKSFGLLNQVANTLKNRIALKVRVEGHTDDVGNADYNMKLSQRRAESVRDYLVKQGVAADRLTAVGYGKTKPLAANTSKRGRDINRRVAFSITE